MWYLVRIICPGSKERHTQTQPSKYALYEYDPFIQCTLHVPRDGINLTLSLVCCLCPTKNSSNSHHDACMLSPNLEMWDFCFYFEGQSKSLWSVLSLSIKLEVLHFQVWWPCMSTARRGMICFLLEHVGSRSVCLASVAGWKRQQQAWGERHLESTALLVTLQSGADARCTSWFYGWASSAHVTSIHCERNELSFRNCHHAGIIQHL